MTDAARGSSLAFIRSLGRQGWRVIAADARRGSAGFRSRYAAEQLVYPPPQEHPHEFVAALLEAARERSIDLIVPITDATILPLYEARDRFEGLCPLALPPGHGLKIAADKLETVALGRSLGVPVPRTHLVQSWEEAARCSHELGWPLVFKPRASSLYHEGDHIDSFEVEYVNEPEQLRRALERFEGRCDVLLQEYYPGTGHGVEMLLHRGRPLAVFQHRRLREVPVVGGASSLRESEPLDPELYAHATRLMQALDWTGLAMVEFKLGREGAKLIEINGRVWGSLPLAVHSGVDFPALLADLCLSGPPASTPTLPAAYRHGLRARNLELDLLWIAQVLLGRRRHPYLPHPRRREALWALLQLLHPAYRDDFLSFADPLPGLVKLVEIARKFRSKLLRGGASERNECQKRTASI